MQNASELKVMHKSVAKILKKLDADKDKSLTLDEIKAHMNKVCFLQLPLTMSL